MLDERQAEVEPLIGWIVRGLLVASAAVAGWFVSEDSASFGIMQMAVATILVALVVFVLAFWPARWTHVLNRLDRQK